MAHFSLISRPCHRLGFDHFQYAKVDQKLDSGKASEYNLYSGDSI